MDEDPELGGRSAFGTGLPILDESSPSANTKNMQHKPRPRIRPRQDQPTIPKPQSIRRRISVEHSNATPTGTSTSKIELIRGASGGGRCEQEPLIVSELGQPKQASSLTTSSMLSSHRHSNSSFSHGGSPPALFTTTTERFGRRRRKLSRGGKSTRTATEGLRLRIAFDMSTNAILACGLLTMLTICGIVFVIQTEKFHSASKSSSIYTPFPTELDRVSKWSEAAPKGKVAVFYNIYFSSQSYLAHVARSIVEEQLDQVGLSYAASSGDLHVYYTLIGAKTDTAWIQSLCSIKYNMTCTFLQQYASADEKVTLSELHTYCQHHPNQSVVYLHNKGSLHPKNKGQHRWRRTMTAAATSEQCLSLSHDDNKCNTCGMLFQPLPALHFPGNMWAARCSYIVKLLSPDEYHARRPVVDEWIRTECDAGVFTKETNLFAMESHYTGNHRYEPEHWVGSHPHLIPCDVSAHANKDYWLEDDRSFAEFDHALAPRHGLHADWIWYGYTAHNSTLSDPVARRRDYFLLRGIVYRWMAFYGNSNISLPVNDDDSWIWTWFPDAQVWKDSIQKDGGLIAINAVAGLSGAAKIVPPVQFRYGSALESLSRAWEALLLKIGARAPRVVAITALDEAGDDTLNIGA